MNYFVCCLFVGATLVTGCSGKKTDQTQETTQQAAPAKLSLPDSIDHAIYVYDQRLDIKMKRKMYEPKPGTLITIQKWFEFGDTTRLVKMRAETLTGDSKMEVTVYHYIGNKLAKLHEYQYDKRCAGGTKECMTEAKFFFANDNLFMAQKRKDEGTSASPPVIERGSFETFSPDKQILLAQLEEQNQVSKKYATLPFPKARPEKGTPLKAGK